MNEKQHVNDLEEELQLIQRHLKTTQAKVAEQVEWELNIFYLSLSIEFSHKKLRISKQRKMSMMHNLLSLQMNYLLHK